MLLAEAFGHGAVATMPQKLVILLALASGSKSADTSITQKLQKEQSLGYGFGLRGGASLRVAAEGYVGRELEVF